MSDSIAIIDLLTLKEVAKLLRVSEMTIRRLIEKREVRFYKLGGSLRFRQQDVMAYMEKQCIESADTWK